MHYDRDRAEVEVAIRGWWRRENARALFAGRGRRRSSAGANAVLAQVFIKERFGEFSRFRDAKASAGLAPNRIDLDRLAFRITGTRELPEALLDEPSASAAVALAEERRLPARESARALSSATNL